MLRLALAYFTLLIAAVEKKKKKTNLGMKLFLMKLFFIKLLIVMQPCVVSLHL